MNSRTTGRHADRVHHTIETNAPARSSLAASWRRSCDLHRLDPAESNPPQRLSGAELRLARERMERLIRAASASMDRLYQAVGGSGCCVLLADTDGVPVDRRGAPGDDDAFCALGLWTGAIWSEDAEGTNGIGTCLIEQRSLTIHRDQHFFARNIGLSCSGAPIYDHEAKLAGVLDVSSCRTDVTPGFANLIAAAVADAVRRIEVENFRLAFPDARILLAPNGDSASNALVAVDQDDLVIGATRSARQSLGLSSARLGKPVPATDLLGGARLAGEAFDRAERGVLQRALARSNGNVRAAADALGISRATLHRKLKRFGLERPN